MERIIVLSKRDVCPEGYELIDVTSRNKDAVIKTLSPFFAGPVKCYDGLVSKNVENAWQYSKVYQKHADESGNPTGSYFDWRNYGFAKSFADRYPMGKGVVPLYSFWKTENGYEKLDYIEARKKIYIPLYAKAAIATQGYAKLSELLREGKNLALVDFDGYRNNALNMTMKDVINDSKRKMGHAFVIKMLLDGLLRINCDTLVDEFQLLDDGK